MSQLIGQTLGRYKIIEEIGEGGMGVVYKAMDTKLDRVVALKVLPPYFARDPKYLERFHREAQAAAQLDGPHILNAFDYGEEDGFTYLAMNYVAGGTLGDLLGQPMDIRKTVDIIGQVGEGLAFAHSRGVVHRDIKPSNILLTEDGRALITDFGIAKIFAASPMTKTTSVFGTPQYMSPEQGSAPKKVDQRSDIYSLAIVLYKMLTGQVPYKGETPVAVLNKHARAPLPRPRQLNPAIPPAVERVVRKALNKRPEDRYQTVGQFVEALCKAANETIPTWVKARHRLESATSTTSSWQRIAGSVRRVDKRIWAAAIAMVVVLLGVVAILVGGWYGYQLYQERQAALHYNEGIKALSARSWFVALQEFEQVLVIDSNYKDATQKRQEAQKQLDLTNLLGEADGLCARSDWSACIEKLERVRELDSEYDQVGRKLFDAYYSHGKALVEDDQLLQAIEQFDKALELNPEAAEVQADRHLVAAYLEGVTAYKDKQWEDAIDSLAKVYETEAKFKKTHDLLYTAYVNYGQELAGMGNIEKGEVYCEEALKIKSDGTEASACLAGLEDQRYQAHVVRANEFLEACRPEEAQAEFEKALAIKPGGTEARDGLDKADEMLTPQVSLIANAERDYSSTQGYNNWYYMAWFGSGWQEMPWDPGDMHWQWGYNITISDTIGEDQIRIYRTSAHPGTHQEVARVWQSPVSGQIRIEGRAKKDDTRGGDGVSVRIVHNSRQIWSEHIRHYDSVGKSFSIDRTVQKGDRIYFIVGNGGAGNTVHDKTYFNPSIYLITYKCQPSDSGSELLKSQTQGGE